MEFRNFDDEEVVLHGRPNLVELEVFGQYHRAGKRTEKTLFDQNPSRFGVKIRAQAFSGYRKDVARYGDVDGVDGNAGKRRDDDDGSVLIEDVEGDLSDVFFDPFAFVVVMDVDFPGILVVMSDIEKFEHGNARKKTEKNGMRYGAFCKFFGGMVD